MILRRLEFFAEHTFIDGVRTDYALLGESSVVVYGEAKTGLILVNGTHGTQVDGFIGIARGAQKRVKSARHGRNTTIVHDIPISETDSGMRSESRISRLMVVFHGEPISTRRDIRFRAILTLFLRCEVKGKGKGESRLPRPASSSAWTR